VTTALPRSPERSTSPSFLERWPPRPATGEVNPAGTSLGISEPARCAPEEVQP
jgi:hypothetical protein